MTAFDAIVVGAGIQGAAMALAVARRGLRPLVIERDSPGGGTTAASLGIVHGGLRHLQRLDIRGWLRSRREQAWFLAEFPDLVEPLTCLMPIYRGTLRSRGLFRAAFSAERAFLGSMHPLPGGSLLEPADVVPGFPLPRAGLVGAACWYEGVLGDASTLVDAMLKRATLAGGGCLRAEVTDLLVHEGRAIGVHAHAAGGGEALELRAPVIILCAGPATRALARRFDRDHPRLSSAVLAFNMVLDLPAPPDVALAVSLTPGRGRSYFMRAHHGALLVGTWYAPWRDGRAPEVSEALIDRALSDVRCCLPGIACSRDSIRGVTAGVLPDLDGAGRVLRRQDVVINHGGAGGPEGLYSVLGVKLTTARALAEHAADRIWPRRAGSGGLQPPLAPFPVSGRSTDRSVNV